METPIPRLRIGSLTLGLVILSLAIAALPASAARWQSVGPDDDGTVLSLAFAPSKPTFVYAGTLGGGVSRSTDGGRTWVSANAGLTDSFVVALAVYPTDEHFVWAATQGGLFRSVNAGRTWRRVFPERVSSVAIDPENPSIVYIGTPNRMFRSGNGGQTWLPMGETLVPFEQRFRVPALVVAPSRPQTLYAAYQETAYPGRRSGIFKSENGGIAWSRIYRGTVSRLAVHPRDPAILWAVDDQGILLTTDGGETWSRVLEGEQVGALALSANGVRVFVAMPGRLRMTQDKGGHWWGINGLTQRPIHSMAVDPANQFRLLAGPEGDGAYTLDWLRATWQRTSDGLAGFAAEALGPSPNGSGFWLASPLGLYQTTDNGASWTHRLSGAALHTVAVAPSDAKTIYAGGQESPPGSASALYCSHDGGESWMLATSGITGEQVLSLAVHPQDPLTAYAGTWFRAYKTTNAGETWTALPLTGIVNGLAFDVNDPERLYATAHQRLYHSHDGGATWHVLMDGGRGVRVGVLRGIALAPTDSRSLAVFDDAWIFLSRDGGQTWQVLRRPGFMTEYRTVAFSPLNEQTILVGGHGGAALSTDGGATWQKLGAGIAGLNVNQLLYDPNNPGRLYAATWAAGVMVLDPAP